MSFQDPIVTQSVDTVTLTPSLVVSRVNTGNYSGEYMASDGNFALTISHTRKNRDRSMMRLDFKKTLPDPIIPSQNVEVGMAAYIVIDRPPVGFAKSDVDGVVKTVIGTLLDGDNLDKFTTFQS